MAIVCPGIVVTSIAVINKGGKNVEFDGTLETGDKARFLKDVKETANGSKKFTATEITPEEAKEIVRLTGSIDDDTTPLFCVHGYQVEPHDMLGGMAKTLKNFKDNGNRYYPIPVLWPCDSKDRWGVDQAANYEWDQEEWSQRAGEALAQFVGKISDDTFPRKSLLMHSMGNHVVFNGACGVGVPKVQFENIFMVAADVPYDIFHENPSNSYVGSNGKVYKNKEKKAANFFKLLARTKPGGSEPKGKICILHNLKDDALYWSSQLNWECRLGQRGAGMCNGYTQWYEKKSLVRDEYKKHYVNKNFEDKIGEMGDKKHKHSYQFEVFAINFYNEMFDKIKADE